MSTSGGLTVVIAAHDRPASLEALGRSLARSEIPAGTELVVSIDGGGDHHAAVVATAKDMTWSSGTKSIVEHDAIGLVEHFHRCGDLSAAGPIVLLEDDLLVAPGFVRWVEQAIAKLADDDRIAGLSLAMPWFDGYRNLPFEPVIDGFDAVFLQVPWYAGMAWTPAMWARYREWQPSSEVAINRAFDSLGADEWFPSVTRYLVDTGRYYAMPREAQATDTGAAGTHVAAPTDFFQQEIALGARRVWNLGSLDDSLAVYDDHMEPTPRVLAKLAPQLGDESVTADLLGVRDLARVEGLVLTTRPVSRSLRSWGDSMHPLVANVVHDVAGDRIHLARVESVARTPTADGHAARALRRHAARGRRPSLRETLRWAIAERRGRT